MTLFIRLLEESVDSKPHALLQAIEEQRSSDSSELSIERAPKSFSVIPGSPFAYWVSESLKKTFADFPRVEADERVVRQGLGTADDFRFVRLWWEVPESQNGKRWRTFVRGGKASRYYGDVDSKLNWSDTGEELKAWSTISTGGDHWSRNIRSTELYFRPGLTWPLRAPRFAPYPIPAGSIFSIRGYAFFAPESELIGALATFSSSAFDFLFKTMLGRHGHPEFIVGILQKMPWARVEPSAQAAARKAWSLKRNLETSNEISHAFVRPKGIGGGNAGSDQDKVERELEAIQSQIDDAAFKVYGISPEDRGAIESQSSLTNSSDLQEEETDRSEETQGDEALIDSDANALKSWFVGVAFDRFDPRLATGERALPPEPEPFDPLPSRSPGMWPKGKEPAEHNIILVDDESHGDDLTARVRANADRIHIDLQEDLRAWFAHEFFPLHIKMYSKSRRKAPIYWQLATPSASYSVWLYIHSYTDDTLFRVQNDYVAPKLAHESRLLGSLRDELGDGGTASQRKQMAAQETFVEELRTLLEEVKRVAPLWNPNLDDGVIINFAPLWRLVPQHKAWQRELKATWDALCKGKYDWSHLAMRLWPERVVPECVDDRSLAIAHGLEDVFWVEGDNGKWKPREELTRAVHVLVAERSSEAVKAALKSLMEAPDLNGPGKRGRKSARA